MKADVNTIEVLARQNREMEMTCRLWISAAATKDERIKELATECDQLRQRVARLTRRLEQRNQGVARQQVRHAR
ncbi:MAG: hypothetical protein V1754_02965 [Pseudomonadota bacterium]